jgi:hypothetical protein
MIYVRLAFGVVNIYWTYLVVGMIVWIGRIREQQATFTRNEHGEATPAWPCVVFTCHGDRQAMSEGIDAIFSDSTRDLVGNRKHTELGH